MNSETNCSFSHNFSQIDSNTNIGQCESTDTAVSQNGLFFILYIFICYLLDFAEYIVNISGQTEATSDSIKI